MAPSFCLQQVKVTLNDDDMDTFVFAVGTKKAMARLQKDMQDLVNKLQNFHPCRSMQVQLTFVMQWCVVVHL